MKKWWFVDIALDKRCYRCHEVVAESDDDARSQLRPEDQWIACVGSKPTKSAKRGRRTFLSRDRVPKCAADLGVTHEKLNELLGEANGRLGALILGARKPA